MNIEDIEYKRFSFNDPVTWSYTLFYTKNSRRDEILYYLHGYKGDDLTWLKAHEEIRKYWEKKNYAPPLVVGVSLGKDWYLFNKNSKKKSGLLKFYLNVIFPRIEKKIGVTVKKRNLMGVSMGALNALQLAFYQPGVYDRLVLVSPPFLYISPYDNQSRIKEYIKKIHLENRNVKQKIKFLIFGKNPFQRNINIMLSVFRSYIPNHKVWLKEYPLNIIDKKLYNNFPKIYLSCGNNDEYGFFYGANIFVSSMEKKKIDIKWSPLPGDHNIKNSQEIASFLME